MIVKNLIRSADDFLLKESKMIVDFFKIEIDSIPVNYLALHKEKNSKEFRINPDLEGVPLNIYTLYSKKFASSAVVYYELSVREVLCFMKNNAIFKLEGFMGSKYYLREAKRDEMSAYALIKSRADYYKNCLV